MRLMFSIIDSNGMEGLAGESNLLGSLPVGEKYYPGKMVDRIVNDLKIQIRF